MKKYGKRLVNLVVVLCFLYTGNLLFWRYWPIISASTAISECRNLDKESLRRFETTTRARVMTLEKNVDPFVEELSGYTLLWKMVTLQKEEYVRELWEKHFGSQIKLVLAPAIEGFIADVHAHHNSLFAEISAETGVQFDPAVKVRLEEDFLSTFNRLGGGNARLAAANLAGGQLVALAAGMLAGKVVQDALKSNWFTMVVAVLVDLITSEVIEENVKAATREKIRYALNEATNGILHGSNGSPGLIAALDEQLDHLNEARRRTILSAVEARQAK